MTPQKQLNLHDPANGVWGDCYRTAIACLLDLRPEEVPHLNEDTGAGDMADQDRKMAAWLGERGLTVFSFPMGDAPIDTILTCLDSWNHGQRFMLTGTSTTGCNHVVICKDKAIEWNTSLTGAEIVGPCDDGFWWITVLAKLV